jgi:hypothetical protein
MSVAGRRLVVAFAVLVVLFGAVGQRPDSGGHAGPEPDGRPASSELVDAAPVGVVPAATRIRTSLDGEPVLLAGSAKTRVGGQVSAVVMLAVAAAVCWWSLRRPDRRLAAPLQRSSLAALRAPPAFV